MKQIRLNKLSLRDFQGGTFTLPANGEDVYLFGENASGKTRIVSAFSWLMFGKDALGRSDFEIKNLDAQGVAAHNLEHTVEADLSVNGVSVNLKKIFSEKWTKKRGNAAREFSGHTTQYFIDGVPAQEKDYIARISEITGDESSFRLLTSPTAFPALHWEKQRKLLLAICGDISDADIIFDNEALKPLEAILTNRTLDDHKKVVTARRSAINKEMERIPVRIDECRRGIPDTTGIDRVLAEAEVKDFEVAINDAKLRLQGQNTGGNIAALSTTLSGINADLRKMEEAHRSGSLSTLNRLNQRISELTEMINSDRRRIVSIDGDLKYKDGTLQGIEKIDLPKLREKWIAIDAETFKDTTENTCPTCGQALPSESVKEAREKALASFNENKADRLGEIDRKGKALKDQRDKLIGEIKAIKEERTNFEKVRPGLEEELLDTQKDRDALKHGAEDFSSLPGHTDLLHEASEIEKQIKEERAGKAEDMEKIKAEIADLQSRLATAKNRVDMFARRRQGEKRIDELKEEEKNLSKEFEDLENQLYLIEQFIKTKVALLTIKINEKFEIVRFKLFNQLINGGIEDCCEITVNGIPFNAGLNNAARIQAGCDIIRTLQEHFQMSAPVFVDNRESVTDLPKMDCQLISLIVSPGDKTLRIETIRERMAA